MTEPTPLTVRAPDGHVIRTRAWRPEGPVTGVVVIVHGVAEHGGRYGRVARALTGAGFAVLAPDHRGHGPSCPPEDLGFFAERDGWDRVIGDIATVLAAARREHPDLPVVLLGHSMGSLIARCLVARHPGGVDALVLTGTVGDQGVVGSLGGKLAGLLRRCLGPRARSRLLNALAFGGNNRAFRPARTDFDWLSRDVDEVDAYIADPCCGFVPTVSLFEDLVRGATEANRVGTLARMDPWLPVLIASGTADPLAPKVPDVAGRMRRAGTREVTLRLYPEARHELFNETNREEVLADLLDWLEVALRGSR